METEDDCVGGTRQRGVGLGDGADAGVDDLGLDLVGFDLVDRVDDRLDGALGVGLDDQLERLVGVGLRAAEQAFQRHFAFASYRLVAFLRDSVLANVSGFLIVWDDIEFRTGFRDAIETEHLHGAGRAGFLDSLALVIDERTGFAVVVTADHDVANL